MAKDRCVECGEQVVPDERLCKRCLLAGKPIPNR